MDDPVLNSDQVNLDHITRRFRRVFRLMNALIVLLALWLIGRAIKPTLLDEFDKVGLWFMTGALIILAGIHSYYLRKTGAEDISQIRRLVIYDNLTSLYNSQYLKLRIEEEIKRSERYKHAFSLLYMDLDRFKRVNDEFGHKAGDEVLVAVAETLRRTCRGPDMLSRVLGRLGGDEFLIMLPETDAPGAHVLAGRIVQRIREFRLEVKPGRIVDFLGISIGISCYPKDGQSRDVLVEEADQAMYKAKKAGGCAIALAPNSGAASLNVT